MVAARPEEPAEADRRLGSLPTFAAGLAELSAGRPEAARRCFEEVLADNPGDVPARYYRDRCLGPAHTSSPALLLDTGE